MWSMTLGNLRLFSLRIFVKGDATNLWISNEGISLLRLDESYIRQYSLHFRVDGVGSTKIFP